MAAHRIYLDKLSTSAHVPNHPLFTAHNESKVFPNMDHTGIPTKFGKYKPPACMPNGRIPKLTKSKVLNKNRLIERERLKLEATERTFVLSHKQFMNNILADLEKVKVEKDSRRHEIWGASVSDFNSSTVGPSLSQPSTSQTRLGSSTSRTSPSKELSVVSKKKRACNREDLYTCLLDSVDPPKTPKEWFGTISREFDTSKSHSLDTSSMEFGPDPLSPMASQIFPSISPFKDKITLAAQEKWEAESIFKALNGSSRCNTSSRSPGRGRDSSKSVSRNSSLSPSGRPNPVVNPPVIPLSP